MNNSKIEIARKWFEELRDKLILNIEKIDSTNFIITEWDHKHQGGGKMSKIKGQVIEKGGVNISTVEGKFEENMIGKVPGTENDSSYQATGISVVLHPHSPFIPSMHFNTRFLKTEQKRFGGGIDVTPCLPFNDEEQYHSSLESLCDKFDKAGMFFSGMSPDNILPETLELNDHPWFIAVQFHPELKSRPFQPHPLFVSFIKASLNQSRLL